jgi:DNA-binding PadR family transcriptional regulator
MRRKVGALVPFEKWILETANAIDGEFYGYQIAKRLKNRTKIIEQGTLYRALQRLENMGYLSSRWEISSEQKNKPSRRYYKLTDKEME